MSSVLVAAWLAKTTMMHIILRKPHQSSLQGQELCLATTALCDKWSFLLDLTTLLWLPFWSIHLTVCVCSTLAHIVLFSPTDGFERRSSGAVQNYLVFSHWDTCSYIQYKIHLFYSNKVSLCSAHYPLPQNSSWPDNSLVWLCKGVFCCAIQNFVFDQSNASQDIF